jgi:hypothetical protein
VSRQDTVGRQTVIDGQPLTSSKSTPTILAAYASRDLECLHFWYSYCTVLYVPYLMNALPRRSPSSCRAVELSSCRAYISTLKAAFFKRAWGLGGPKSANEKGDKFISGADI